MATSTCRQMPSTPSRSTAADVDANDGDTTECGIGPIRPTVLTMCANMPVFTGFYSASALMTSTLSSYVNSQVTTLERHFGFSSAQTGLIMAANDVGFLTVVLFVSFLAARAHIPRALGAFTILYGLSGIICALPHFLFGAPSPTSWTDDAMANASSLTSAKQSQSFSGQLCDRVNHTSLTCDLWPERSGQAARDEDAGERVRANTGTALALIVVGMILQGVAKTPRAAFTTFYVDNNVEKVKTGFYMGIIITIAIVGPAIAFALGGIFTRIYVTLEDTDLHYRHPKWIGAWWLGYLAFGCAACFIALPLFCFPRQMKGGNQIAESVSPPAETASDVHTPVSRMLRMTLFVKGFVRSLVRLWTNPVYVFTVLSSCAVIITVAGSQSFNPKYIENQFAFPAWKANMAMAGVMLGTACLGTFLGGYLSKRRKMGPMSSLKFLLFSVCCTVLFFSLQILFKCDQPYLYNSPGPRATPETSLEGCVEECACDDDDYFPVCADDGRTFFSPCHAGCRHTDGGLYTNCTCIEGGRAVAGMCDYSCPMFYPFIVCFSLGTLMSTLAIIPKLIIYIRAVEERDKALALGFSTFSTSVIGWLLAPICFGKLIDGICIQWERSCGERGGACLLYDNDNFRFKLLGYQAGFRALSLVLILCAYVSARVTKKFHKNEAAMTPGDIPMPAMPGEKIDNSPGMQNRGDNH